MTSRAAWAKALGQDPGKPGRRTSLDGLTVAPAVVKATKAKQQPKHSLASFAPLAKPKVRREDRYQQYLDDLDAYEAHDDLIPLRQDIQMVPVPKPRMSQRDTWEKRPAVLRYRAFCDEIRLKGAKLPHAYRAVFILPMPEAWPDDLKAQMAGRPALLKPDTSNLIKALEDALVAKDEALFCIGGLKFWGYEGRITILKESLNARQLRELAA